MAAIFSEYEGVEAISAGTNADCETPVSGDLIKWADVVLVMENSHRNKVAKKFRPLLKDKKLALLNIPNDFDFMDPTLIRILMNRVPPYVPTR